MPLGRTVACWLELEVPDNVIGGESKNPITIVRFM